jgi:curved DNA-binding protein CbpA
VHKMSKAAELEDYWAILGLPAGATKTEVQKAYRKKSKDVHPDRYRGDDPQWATEEFLRLTRAKEVLEDDKARAAFEALQKARAMHREKQEAQDAGRRKLREDLEAREEAARKRARTSGPSSAEVQSAQQQAQQEAAARADLARELERLRRTGRLGAGVAGQSASQAAPEAETGEAATAPATGREARQTGGGTGSVVNVTLRWATDKHFDAVALKKRLVELLSSYSYSEDVVVGVVGTKAVVELPSAAAAKALAERSALLASDGIRLTVPASASPAGGAAGSGGCGGGGAGDEAGALSTLPAGWREQPAPDGRIFFYHVATRRSQWTRPALRDGGAPAHVSQAEYDELESLTLQRLKRASERQKTTPHTHGTMR